MRHTISVLVENEFGVLARVSGLFSGRGFNIESLTVAETLDPSVSRITLVTRGDDQVLAQVNKQLNKLINVIQVMDFTSDQSRRAGVGARQGYGERSYPRGADEHRRYLSGEVIDVSPQSYLIEVTGDEEKITAIVELLRPLGIKEIARTGKVAMHRGMQLLSARHGKEKVA